MALRLAGAGPIVAAGRSAGRRAAAADVGADVVIEELNNMEQFAGKTAVVTGAGSGMGKAFVPRMLAHGEPAHVVNTCSMTSVVTAAALCPGTIATNLFHGSRNRPADLTDSGGNVSADGKELRERMHATLAAGMPPAEVADKLVTAIRGGGLYLLTDHEWDEQIIRRHDAILAGAVGPAASDILGGAR